MKLRWILFLLFTFLLLPCCLPIAGGQAAEEWPSAVERITYLSSADNTKQPAMFYATATPKPKPLLVALHTWSSDYTQETSLPYAKWCIEHDWVLIHPNFRGPNQRPEATGSELVVKDILSAVDYAKRRASVDDTRIYLVGASGGGYTSLLMAGRAPEVWAGVSAWVPITDLTAWYYESKQANRKFAQEIAASCGGVPEEGSAAKRECRKRSPITYIERASQIPLDINAGIHDGHTGSVSISHSLRAFNMVSAERDRVAETDIIYFVNEAKVPAHLQSGESYPAYGTKPILFRRQSGNARVTIFDGGHEIDTDAALNWLAGRRKSGR